MTHIPTNDDANTSIDIRAYEPFFDAMTINRETMRRLRADADAYDDVDQSDDADDIRAIVVACEQRDAERVRELISNLDTCIRDDILDTIRA